MKKFWTIFFVLISVLVLCVSGCQKTVTPTEEASVVEEVEAVEAPVVEEVVSEEAPVVEDVTVDTAPAEQESAVDAVTDAEEIVVEENEDEPVDENVVAIVNDEKIYLDEFKETASFNRFNYLQQYNSYLYYYSMYGISPDQSFNDQFEAILGESGKEALGQETLNQLIYYRILEAIAKEQNIEVTEDQMTEALKQIFGLSVAEEETEAPAEEGGLSLDTADVVEPVTESDKQDELEATIKHFLENQAQGAFSEECLRKYIRGMIIENAAVENMMAELVFEDEMVSARHILVETEDLAKEIKAKLDAGESWDDLAAEHSIDTSNKDKGGDLGWFAKGQMVPEFEEAAYALEPGSISDPVATDFGYHIIASDGKEVRPLEGEALTQAQNKAYAEWRYTIFDKYLYETFDVWKDNVPMVPEFVPVDLSQPEETAVETVEESSETTDTEISAEAVETEDKEESKGGSEFTVGEPIISKK